MMTKEQSWTKLFLLPILAVLLLISGLTGCSSPQNSSSEEKKLYVVSYSNADTTFPEQLKSVLQPSVSSAVECTNILMGAASEDPNGAAGGVLQLSGLIANKKIDVLLADKENLTTYAGQDGFYRLDEIFTQEELEALGVPVLSLAGADGTEKGYALDLSGSAQLKEQTRLSDVGLAVIINAQDKESVKAAVTALVKDYTK